MITESLSEKVLFELKCEINPANDLMMFKLKEL